MRKQVKKQSLFFFFIIRSHNNLKIYGDDCGRPTVCVFGVCVFKREVSLTGLCPVDLYSSMIDGVGRQRRRVVGNPRHSHRSYNLS